MPRIDAELLLLLERKAYYEKHPEEARLHPGAVPDPKQVLNISVKFDGSADALRESGFIAGSTIGQVAFGTITLENLPRLVANPKVLTIDKQRRKNLSLDASVPDIKANQVWSLSGETFSGFTGRNTIVGIVDTGINFRHESFRNPDGTTRIKRIWDQTLAITGSETAPAAITDAAIGNIPLGYGVEYTEQQINGTLQNAPLPVTVRHQDANSHGTHVAGIAAGNGRNAGSGGNTRDCQGRYTYIGVAPEADIVMVRLWGLTTGDTNSPATTTGTMIDAISYILNLAKHTLNKPVVINLSLGLFSENMDGSTNECTTMDGLLSNAANDEGFAIVFAAGNEASSNFHAKLLVAAGPPAPATISSLRFFVPAHDATKGNDQDRSIRIVYTGANLQVRVTSPVSGPTGIVGWVTPNNSQTSNTANGPNLPGQTTAPSVSITNNPNSITITLNHGSGTNTNFGGNWLIELQDTSASATTINAFCLYGSGHDPESPYFLDSTTKMNTLSEESTANNVITVGSYNVANGILAASSGRGLTLDLRLKPEITAPGVGIHSAAIESATPNAGCCCDCCHDYYTVKSGTSMAAPHVAGTIALLLQKDPNLTHNSILTALSNNARPAPTGLSIEDEMGWGVGKLDAKAAIDSVTAPGGGGGVAGPHTPFYKSPVTEVPRPKDDTLYERFRRSKRGPELLGLFNNYFREIRDLINSNKRVATVWHRSKGPGWVRAAIRAGYTPDQPLPFEIEGFSLREAIGRMMDILHRYGSKMLVTDLDRYQEELTQLQQGMNVYQLMELFTEPATVHT